MPDKYTPIFSEILDKLGKIKSKKDKVLHQKYKGLSANVVKEAFDWDDNYMLIEHDTYPQAPGAANG